MHQKAIRDVVARDFKLSENDLSQTIPSGGQTTFANRVHWACTYLKKAGLLESSERGFVRITPLGKEILASNPARIDRTFLMQFPEFSAFQNRKSSETDNANGENKTDADSDAEQTQTPQEILEAGYQSLRNALVDEILQQVTESSTRFFEKLVVDLIVKMGYGGSQADAGRSVGKSGDGGIVGIIKQDRLGLDTIYLQAKRWTENSVGRPEIQQFAGALAGHGAQKGVFIATSHFTRDAQEYARALTNSKIVLIDGEKLATLMMDHNVGVALAANYEVKRLDSDYFEEIE